MSFDSTNLCVCTCAANPYLDNLTQFIYSTRKIQDSIGLLVDPTSRNLSECRIFNLVASILVDLTYIHRANHVD